MDLAPGYVTFLWDRGMRYEIINKAEVLHAHISQAISMVIHSDFIGGVLELLQGRIE